MLMCPPCCRLLLYLVGIRYESQPGYELSWLRFPDCFSQCLRTATGPAQLSALRLRSFRTVIPHYRSESYTLFCSSDVNYICCTICRMEGNMKMDLREIECGDRSGFIWLRIVTSGGLL
jgi:hypothetical protein